MAERGAEPSNAPKSSGRIQRRLAAAIVLTALIPLLVAIFLAESLVRQSSARFFIPEIGARLDQSLGLYRELARTVKSDMRHQASTIAAHGPLLAAALAGEPQAIERELTAVFRHYPGLVSLQVHDADGRSLGRVDRGRPVDEETEFELQVQRPLGDRAASAGAEVFRPSDDTAEAVVDGGRQHEGPVLTATFAADRARFDGLEGMSQFVDAYARIEQRREQDEESYVLAFAVLLGITILAAIFVGTLLARSVSTRIAGLAEATRRVGAGDLAIRVSARGRDEIADLASAFNRMLAEVEASRARIEYLQRIGAWQDMARRLAHEIKNPLTPIQLAAQEAHERYRGDDAEYRKLLDTTREIIEAEVASLRRLVGEFSDFARLPQARLREGDLVEVVSEQADHLSLLDDDDRSSTLSGQDGKRDPDRGVKIAFDLPEGPASVYLDREMIRRALANLLRNAVQAVEGSGRGEGRVRVSVARQGDFWTVDVDDDGPGIAPELQGRIFDPYVTSKTDGAGLGLAIVKKIVVEHGGDIAVHRSPLGGARVRLSFPEAGTPAAAAALESAASEPSGAVEREAALR